MMGTNRRSALVRAIPIALLALPILGAGPADAAATPSFSDVSAAAADQHDVTATFTETGLTPNQLVTESLRARARDAYACYSASGDRVGSAALIERPSNENQVQASSEGSVVGATLTTSVGPQDVCPNGETSYLYKTVFGRLRLTDVTNSVSVGIPGKYTSCSPADCIPPTHL